MSEPSKTPRTDALFAKYQTPARVKGDEHVVTRDEALATLARSLETALSASQERGERLSSFLRRMRQWDMLDTSADGLYWRTEIDAVLGERHE